MIGWREKKKKQEEKIIWQRMKRKANEENPKSGSSRGGLSERTYTGFTAGAALQLMLCQD